MKLTLQAFSLALPCLLLLSCEGYRCATGIVQDAASLTPLDSVLVTVSGHSLKAYTDSNGTFDVCNRMATCFPECKDITVSFSRKGYQTVTLTNPPEGIVLLRQ